MRAPTHNVCVIFTGCFVLSPNHLAAKHGNKNGAFIIGQWTLKINSRNLWLIWTVGLVCVFFDYRYLDYLLLLLVLQKVESSAWTLIFLTAAVWIRIERLAYRCSFSTVPHGLRSITTPVRSYVDANHRNPVRVFVLLAF